MKKHYWIIGACIAIILFVFLCGRSSVKPIIIEHTTVDTTTIKVTVHDTIKKDVPRDQIKYTRIIKHDTIYQNQVLAVRNDTENCYSFEQTNGGISAKMTVCSKEFPAKKPDDAHGELELSLPNDTQVTTSRTIIQTAQPKKKRFALTIGPSAGVDYLGRPTAGASIQFGLKLKEW